MRGTRAVVRIEVVFEGLPWGSVMYGEYCDSVRDREVARVVTRYLQILNLRQESRDLLQELLLIRVDFSGGI